MPGSVPGSENIVENKRDKVPIMMEFTILEEGRENR